jgi:hypothetical protein
VGLFKANPGNILLPIFYWKILAIYWKIDDEMVRGYWNYCNILPIFPPQGNIFIGNILLQGYDSKVIKYFNLAKTKGCLF